MMAAAAMTAGAAHATMRTLPILTFEAIFGPAPILVLAPHPDDESLGCGGAIAEACARRHPIHVAILTDGAGSHPNSPTWPAARLIDRRRSETRSATALLGLPAGQLHFLDEPDTRAPHGGPAFDAALDRLCGMLAAARIGTVCTTWAGDPHTDHVAAALLGAAACRRLDLVLLSYPVWGWTLDPAAAVPAVARGARLDIARHLPRKRQAIAAHVSQHPGLITDDPGGFHLPRAFLAHFDSPYETFLEQA